jgi:hypothetical protein
MFYKLSPLLVSWAIAAIICVAGASYDMAPAHFFVGLFIALSGGIAAGFITGAGFSRRVDPWLLQKRLMDISNQPAPNSPMLTKGTLLYYALQLEEMGEQARTLLAIMMHHLPPKGVVVGYEDYRDALHMGEPMLRQLSASLRRHCAQCPDDWGLSLNRPEAKALLDDHVDVMVVASGFGLATGLPGPAGYLAVQASNLSKANPETGMIDTDPSGKWIKGVGYFPPALEKVLEDHMT